MNRNAVSALLLIGLSQFAFAQQATVNVVLHPGGSFKAETSDVVGFATKTATGIVADNIIVDLSNLKTGISLRDKHTKNHLEVEKYPKAILIHAEGKDGAGKGMIKIKDIEQPITGTYEISGTNVIAHFPLHLSQFKIDGIKYMSVGVDDEVKLDVTLPIKETTTK